jgi:hypothetical protein
MSPKMDRNIVGDGTYTLQLGYFVLSNLGIAEIIAQSPMP